MGIPKFFLYISERYPSVNEQVKELQTPEFDNFYVDMNGIIHNCTHPNDSDVYFVMKEENMFANIFHYLEVIFNIIKPKKLFFLAVDGVAPRAKINQQRARRFRNAKDLEQEKQNLIAQGKKPMPEERFDSNSITPGTVFMERLHSQLQYFVTSKISTDPSWQQCKVILSGHQTPGEGEHKIMEYIRYLRSLPDYDPNTRHCLYGLDADLIILGLSTHEPYFCLLREKVYGRKQKSSVSVDEQEFIFLYLSIMREYIDLEFQELKEHLKFDYNLENIIDDWILMGFLIGNDFIPNLPNLHINKGAFPVLYKAYKEVLPQLEGYLNENGYLNLPRFQKYMERLGKFDMEMFEETYADLAYFEEKTGKNSLLGKTIEEESLRKTELDDLIRSTNEMFLDFEEESLDDENDTFVLEFCQHKKDYYTKKLDCAKLTDEVMQAQAEGYIRAIQWNLHYYYQGCQSWSWFYPHHYSPYISDITNFKDLKLDFDMGKPFLPFEQLLAVLPAASKKLLPETYWNLMTSPESPIIDFYPEDFETDLNGKLNEWEAVVLIPFIDEERLLKAMEPSKEKLSSDEIRRNRHEPMSVYEYTQENLGVYKALDYFPTVEANHALEKKVFLQEIIVEKSKIKYGLLPGFSLDFHFPRFPSLRHIPFEAALKSIKIKVFDFASKGETMVLSLKERDFPTLEELAKTMVGKIVYVNWPHLKEAKVLAIADEETEYSITKENLLKSEKMNKATQIQWLGCRQSIVEFYLNKLGIEIRSVDVVVYAAALEGWKCSFEGTGPTKTEKFWSSTVSPYPLQVIIEDTNVNDHVSCQSHLDLQKAFPVNSVVFMLGQPHFGSMGKVLDSSECYGNGRLKVAMSITKDPPLKMDDLLKFQSKVVYLPCRIAALKVGISPILMSRITGCILIQMSEDVHGSRRKSSKINIGLNLKLTKQDEELPGYTKKKNDFWLYSNKVVDLVGEYVEKFSEVINHLSNNPNSGCFLMQEIFPGPEGGEKVKKIVNWIKAQEFNKVKRNKCGSKLLESEIVEEIEKIVDNYNCEPVKKIMQVKPHLLYKSDLVSSNLPPVKNAKHKLLDRVVSIRSSFSVPTGLRGFIIGIHRATNEADYVYDVLFDKPFIGGMTINSSPERAYRLSGASFINISNADRVSQMKLVPSLLADLQSAKAPNRTPQKETKISAFAQWNHILTKPSTDNKDEHFQQMWFDLQKLKPQEGTSALRKILKIDEKDGGNQKRESEIKDSVKSFFENVSKVKNSTLISTNPEPVIEKRVDQISNKYCSQLFSYYQRKNLGQPRFTYNHIPGKVMAQIHIEGGKVYSGLYCEDKDSACESAALQALSALGVIPLNKKALVQERKKSIIKENQTKLTKALFKEQDPKEIPTQVRKPTNRVKPIQNNYFKLNNISKFLPDPPLEWTGSGKHRKQQNIFYSQNQGNNSISRTFKGKIQDVQSSNTSKKLAASALEFVPLQAIIGKRNFGNVATTQPSVATVSTHHPDRTKKIDIVTRTPEDSKPQPLMPLKPRRPKIAANLALDPNLN